MSWIKSTFSWQAPYNFFLVSVEVVLSLVTLGSLSFRFSDSFMLFIVSTCNNIFLNTGPISHQGQVDYHLACWVLFFQLYGVMIILNTLYFCIYC
jgi:hypothetical protein